MTDTPEAALPATAGTSGTTRRVRGWLLLLLAATAAMALYGQRGGAGFEPIDCWVAQTAREMLDVDEWLVPLFAGETRMQKSPGPYWAVMLTSLATGRPIDEMTARLPNAVFAVAFVLIIFWLTRVIAGDRAALFGGYAAASSVLVLWWSHRAASDFGLATWTALSLAAIYIALEHTPRGPRRVALLVLGYFAAGMGMLWKMPMPLAVVGLPAVAYVVVLRRWHVLANPWHLAGLVVFALPWLPWAIAVIVQEPNALAKWRVETVDRFTGDLPNVVGQNAFGFLFTYFVPMALYCAPYSLSLPAAFSWIARPRPGIDLRGVRFMALWVAVLFVFFTASTGKEHRYFLPALPPLFVLLGIELSSLFDPQRPRPAWLTRLVMLKTWIVLPAGVLIGGYYGLRAWWNLRGQYELADLHTWADVWPPALVAGLIACVGFAIAATLYHARRRVGSFAMLVGTMFVLWAWVWPQVMPLFLSQRPFVHFAQELRTRVSDEARAAMFMVGTHESRLNWYGDLRFPRLLDQLALLEEQQGRRTLEYEVRRYGEAIIERLSGQERVLLVMPVVEYLKLLIEGPRELAKAGRARPPMHLWLQSQYGYLDRQMVLFSNQPPPWEEPPLRLPDKLRARLEREQALLPPWTPAPAVEGQP